jgi:putative hydrolase of the HAD superfamily
MQWFEPAIASFEIGHRKPAAEIFRHTLQRTGVSPSRAVFIDDVLSHVHGARSLGIRSHQFSSAAKLLADLNGIL